MEKNYVFIKSKELSYDLNTLNYTDIHFWNITNITNKKSNQNVYFYCKNLNDIDFSIKNQSIPHITFIEDSIFSSFYKDTLKYNLERFWFPGNKNFTQEYIDKFIQLQDIDKTPIAIVFNPAFQSDIDYNDFFKFIKKLNSQYVNPLYFKDLSLQENEIFSLDNCAIIDNETYYVVLGLFGDYYSKEKPSNQAMTFGILKDKTCIRCEYAQTCKDRGLGLIKFEQNIHSCIGIKLFQQN